MRTALLVLHVTSGVAGLFFGVLALRPPRTDDGRALWRVLYACCLVALMLGLVGLVAYDWSSLDGVARIVFVGLAGLGAVIIARMVLAWRVTRSAPRGWEQKYIDHIFFTYVSLWVGFLIVPAINSPLPIVVVPLVVVAVPAVGVFAVSRYKRRVLMA